jgi:hypothetical protein
MESQAASNSIRLNIKREICGAQEKYSMVKLSQKLTLWESPGYCPVSFLIVSRSNPVISLTAIPPERHAKCGLKL